MIRTIIGWTLFFPLTVISGTVAILLSLFDISGNTPHLVARLWAKILLGIAGTKVQVQGLENMDPQKSYILVSNHQSTFDIFTLLGYLPHQFRWIAKASLFRAPFLGWAMSRIGYIPIERDSPKKAYRSMLRAAERVQQGVSVIIFPEGTRSPDGHLQPFKKGVFLIALKSQAPILPIAIRGTAQIMPKGSLRAYPGNVQIFIGPPIETAGIPSNREAELSERVRSALFQHIS